MAPSESPTSPTTFTSTTNKKPTIYFAYGSNLWLHQMRLRCPSSHFIGVARLNSYRWIINDRGYANVVEQCGEEGSKNASLEDVEFKEGQEIGEEEEDGKEKSKEGYQNVVYGLVYTLTSSDETSLDRNEGVPIAYKKEHLACDLWSCPSTNNKITPSTSPTNSPTNPPIDTTKPPTTLPMLVYIDRQRTTPSRPRAEYIVRMNHGVEDALRMGVPRGYVDGVVRGYIPAPAPASVAGGEDGRGKKKGKGKGMEKGEDMRDFAERQAARFEDESGVV